VSTSRTWQRLFSIPYGPGHRELGLADSHGGAVTAWGPEFGAQAEDGSWWFLDVQKRRLAHYDDHGRYLGQVHIPGRYVGLQMLHVLRSGWMFASGGSPQASMISNGRTARRIELPTSYRDAVWDYDDGERIYGQSGEVMTISGWQPQFSRGAPRRTAAGVPFIAFLNRTHGATVVLQRPDGPGPALTRIHLRSRSARRPLIAMYEVATDRADRIYLLVYGQSGHRQVGALLTVLPSGAIRSSRPIPNTFGAHDPGSPAHLRALLASPRPAVIDDGKTALIVYLPGPS